MEQLTLRFLAPGLWFRYLLSLYIIIVDEFLDSDVLGNEILEWRIGKQVSIAIQLERLGTARGFQLLDEAENIGNNAPLQLQTALPSE